MMMDHNPGLTEDDHQSTGSPGSPAVRIKGRSNGLVVQLGAGPWEAVMVLLAEHLRRAEGFFQGERVALEVGQRTLTAEQLERADAILDAEGVTLWAVHTSNEQTYRLIQELGLEAAWQPAATAPTARVETPTREEQTAPTTRGKEATKEEGAAADHQTDVGDTEAGPTHPYFYQGTLRSGQVLRHAGPIFIVGDVNPGAEVISGSHIYIWGRLRGIVHAGAMGDESAVVGALDFEPIQLRIAGHIAMSPKGAENDPGRWFWKQGGSGKPEVAHVVDEQLVVDPWDARTPPDEGAPSSRG